MAPTSSSPSFPGLSLFVVGKIEHGTDALGNPPRPPARMELLLAGSRHADESEAYRVPVQRSVYASVQVGDAFALVHAPRVTDDDQAEPRTATLTEQLRNAEAKS